MDEITEPQTLVVFTEDSDRAIEIETGAVPEPIPDVEPTEQLELGTYSSDADFDIEVDAQNVTAVRWTNLGAEKDCILVGQDINIALATGETADIPVINGSANMYYEYRVE